MAWVAVDRDGSERIYHFSPYREADYWTCPMAMPLSRPIELPKGSIKKLIGRDLTWKDDPSELKEE